MGFNPLFIGAGFLTREACVAFKDMQKFQSPINRVWVSNLDNQYQHQHFYVSIPYSSGLLGLKRLFIKNTGPCLVSIPYSSGLLFGCLRSGSLRSSVSRVSIPYSSGLLGLNTMITVGPYQGLFQSPIHRDFFSDSRLATASICGSTSFNPLFIGSGLLTISTDRDGALWAGFQSPIDRDFFSDALKFGPKALAELKSQSPIHRDSFSDWLGLQASPR